MQTASNGNKPAGRVRKAPGPQLNPKTPVDWWFLFKFNSAEQRGNPKPRGMTGIFDVAGWKRPLYENDGRKFSQHYLFASSRNPQLQPGRGILGSTRFDPLGSTFAQVYFGSYYYVIWNDQFYGDPHANVDSPWGHSKGLLAWNDDGEGFVMQVSTPSWPASGSRQHPRATDGNTLGFVRDDDIEVSQHFFALKLDVTDVARVLAALQNASVFTLPGNPQLVRNGGPGVLRSLVKSLGKLDRDDVCTHVTLSSGVHLISKPSALAVPPWQLVSSELGGIPLRVASWWDKPCIPSTTAKSPVPGCWDKRLRKPGAVDIAIQGTWREKGGYSIKNLGLTGGMGGNHNHGKFGVSTRRGTDWSIFGDMNQQGALCAGACYARQTCASSQNGRGGLFFAMQEPTLHASLSGLLSGASAPNYVVKSKG